MSSSQPLEGIEVSKSHQPVLPTPVDEKHLELVDHKSAVSDGVGSEELHDDGFIEPTEDELHTLRRVPGRVPWPAYTVALVELCERFSYYGTTIVFVNFIQQPLPIGSTTGAVTELTPDQPGALGMGQRAATGLTLFNTFWAYVTPLLGGYLADQFWGRYRTIMYAIVCALVGHVILIVSALPPVIAHPNGAIAAFSIGLVIMGMGTGGFKPNISPLIAEQYQETRMYIKTLDSGERVIVDPVATISRVMMYFYMMINIGSLTGQIGMVYAEKYIGFWLSYMLPTVMFCFAPLIMIFCRKRYVLRPPTGSVLAKSLQTWKFAMKGRWSVNPAATVRNMRDPNFWESVKPSKLENKPAWMTFDDAWVDEVSRGFKACTVFLWYPLYWLAYAQMTNNLTSQAATMELNGVPNDILSNMNPISLIIFIPLTDQLLYPALRKYGINFSPLKRITAGFYMGTCAMIAACVTQYYIYHLGKCGEYMNDCDEDAPINVWVQSIPYVLIGISEIFASITGLEYAFTKAPRNMRSFVTAFFLFQNAFSSAISQALVSLAEDPLLVWNYGVVAVLAFIGGTGFWLTHRKLDREEDHLNQLEISKFGVTESSDSEKGGEK